MYQPISMMYNTRLIFSFLILFAISYFRNEKHFDKIIFHAGRCLGDCPTYHLEIQGDGKVQLFAERVSAKSLFGRQDTGHFEGVATRSLFNKLNKIIDTIGVEHLKFNGATCCDGSLITIIVYRHGKRTFLRSMFPPGRSRALIKTLYQLCADNKLKRTRHKFNIEGSSYPSINVNDVKFPPK